DQDQDQDDEDNDLDPEPINAIIPYDPNPHQPGRRRKRRRWWGGDPTHPKPNRSGYSFFFAEKHSMVKSLYPNKRGFTKMVGNSWNNLSPEERMVYQKIGLEDKGRYKRELDEYKNLKQRHGELNGSSVAPY
ncbi:High mobility group B protein 9-like protein, partial [Drosera capensis]